MLVCGLSVISRVKLKSMLCPERSHPVSGTNTSVIVNLVLLSFWPPAHNEMHIPPAHTIKWKTFDGNVLDCGMSVFLCLYLFYSLHSTFIHSDLLTLLFVLPLSLFQIGWGDSNWGQALAYGLKYHARPPGTHARAPPAPYRLWAGLLSTLPVPSLGRWWEHWGWRRGGSGKSNF